MGARLGYTKIELLASLIDTLDNEQLSRHLDISRKKLVKICHRYGIKRNYWKFSPSLPDEQWKWARHSNVLVSDKGRFRRIPDGMILSPWRSGSGYFYLEIKLNHEARTVLAHRLVATAFVKNTNPRKKTEVNHKNGIKEDWIPCNLEWVTPSENVRHSLETGLKVMPKGHAVHNSILTPEQVIRIRQSGPGHFRALAREMKVDKGTITNCFYQRTYSDTDI